MDFENADFIAVMAAALEKWTFLNSHRKNKLWIWQECRLTWERKFGETWGEIMDNRSHRFLPEAFQTVETAVAQIMQQVMPTDRFFKPLGRNKLSQGGAASLEAKMRWDNYRMHYRDTFKMFVKKACVDGNVPWTYKWHTEQSLIPDEEVMQQKADLEGLGVTAEINDPANLGMPTKSVTTFEGGRLVLGDIFNYVQDRHPDDPRYALRFYRSTQTKEYIEASWKDLKDANGKPVYKNLEQLSNSPHNYEVADALKRAIDASVGYAPLPEDKVELITFCGDLVVPGRGFYHNVFGVIANRCTLIRFCSNPWAHGLPPWQMFTLIPDPHDPFGYGTGLIEPALGIFDLINVRANQTVDANSLAITPPLGVVEDGITNTRGFVWGPGELLFQRAIGNIAPLNVTKDALQLGLQEIQFYKGEIAGATGVSGGVSTGPAGITATEASGIQQAASAVRVELGNQVKNAGLLSMLRMHASLNQQLMHPDDRVMVRLFADETGVMRDPANGTTLQRGVYWAEVSGSDIQGEFDYEIIGADQIAQSQTMQQNQMNFINSARQDPQFQRRVNMDKFYSDSMEKLGFVDAWKYMRTDEEVAAYDAQQAALAAGMGQPNSPGGPTQGAGNPGGAGVPSFPGNAGGGGSPARQPFPEQLAGPSLQS